MKISVVIATKNEEDSIAECINSASFSDDIVIIDDNSNDSTISIATHHGARTYKRKLDGFATQKNFGVQKARYDWVLILDADERVSKELASEITSLKQEKNTAAYSIPFKNHLGGRWLKYGGLYPDRHTRLFNKNLARYGKREIHEMLEIEGDVSNLNGDIIHYTYKNYSEYWEKVKKYSKLEAKTRSQKPRYRHVLKEFLSRYFRQQGYRDGIDGLFSAIVLSLYIYRMRKEMS